MMEGMLWKEGLLGMSWTQYHFVCEHGMLRYHEMTEAERYDTDRSAPRGTALLATATLRNTKTKREGRWALRLDFADHQKWVLAADTPKEAAQWASVIQRCGATCLYLPEAGATLTRETEPNIDGFFVRSSEQEGVNRIVIRAPSEPLLDRNSARSDGRAPKNYFRQPSPGGKQPAVEALVESLDRMSKGRLSGMLEHLPSSSTLLVRSPRVSVSIPEGGATGEPGEAAADDPTLGAQRQQTAAKCCRCLLPALLVNAVILGALAALWLQAAGEVPPVAGAEEANSSAVGMVLAVSNGTS